MSHHDALSVVHEGRVSTVTLDAPPMNLLDPELMDALVAVHREADAHPDTRVIVSRSGVPGVFSNGLNPMAILDADLDGRKAFFAAVGRMVHGLYALRKPHIAVVDGPAMAGGAVLAITADWRIFSTEGRISFAESKVGLPVPGPLAAIVRAVCDPRQLRDVLILAKNCDAQAALDAGLADAVVERDALDAAAEKHAERIARLSPSVLAETKAALRAPVLAETAAMGEGMPERFSRYLTDEYLGEGLRAILENRHANFKT